MPTRKTKRRNKKLADFKCLAARIPYNSKRAAFHLYSEELKTYYCSRKVPDDLYIIKGTEALNIITSPKDTIRTCSHCLNSLLISQVITNFNT